MLDPTVKPKSGPYYTKMLFKEFNPDGPYTLKDVDDGEHRSLFRLYMESQDLLEHRFASEFLAGYNHWLALCNAHFFKPFIERWRKELELSIRGNALKGIVETSQKDTKDTFAARKFLVDGGWKERNEKGRPSKDAINKKAAELAADELRISDDFERLLGTVSGNA